MNKKSIAIVAAAGIGLVAAVALFIDDHNAWKREIPYAVSELESRASASDGKLNIMLAKGHREDWFQAVKESGEPYEFRSDWDCSALPVRKVIQLQGVLDEQSGDKTRASVLTESVDGKVFTAYATPRGKPALWTFVRVKEPGAAWPVEQGECPPPASAGLADNLVRLMGLPREQFWDLLASFGGTGNVLRVGDVAFEVKALWGADDKVREVRLVSVLSDSVSGPLKFDEVMAAFQKSGSHPVTKSEVSGGFADGREVVYKFWTFRREGEVMRTIRADLYFTTPSHRGNQILLQIR